MLPAQQCQQHFKMNIKINRLARIVEHSAPFGLFLRPDRPKKGLFSEEKGEQGQLLDRDVHAMVKGMSIWMKFCSSWFVATMPAHQAVPDTSKAGVRLTRKRQGTCSCLAVPKDIKAHITIQYVGDCILAVQIKSMTTACG